MRKISYEPLWKTMDQKNIKKNRLREEANISSSTFTKLINSQDVTTTSLARICNFLDVEIEDVVCCEHRSEVDEL